MRRNAYWNVRRLAGESEAEFAWRAGHVYFDAQQDENAEWWRRIGTTVDLEGRRVLEIGCGFGALSFQALDRGARQVTGIDLDASRIAFARGYLEAHRPDRLEAVTFQALPLHELHAEAMFDIVLSKDTFEHVEGLARLLQEAHCRLEPGGMLVFGFSPLYYSPNGDHGRYRLPLPWLHAVLPDPLLFRWASRRLGQPIRSAAQVGLNCITTRKFLQMLEGGGWEQLSLRINPIAHPLCGVFNLLRRLPPLEKFFTIGVYGVFRKRKAAAGSDRHRISAAAQPGRSDAGAGAADRQAPVPRAVQATQ
jgi:2-polyprenyl-3-methyl-5-hydroxy-6-metoxy-1,4-benzoquinol methylase